MSQTTLDRWGAVQAELDRRAAEIERLRECLMGSDMLAHVRGEQIERLKAALEYIQNLPLGDELDIARRAARRALEGK